MAGDNTYVALLASTVTDDSMEHTGIYFDSSADSDSADSGLIQPAFVVPGFKLFQDDLQNRVSQVRVLSPLPDISALKDFHGGLLVLLVHGEECTYPIHKLEG